MPQVRCIRYTLFRCVLRNNARSVTQVSHVHVYKENAVLCL